MRPPSRSREFQRWLVDELGAVFVRQARHGAFYTRTCPNCGRQLHIVVPQNRERLRRPLLMAFCHEAHVTIQGEPRCQ